VLCGGEGEGGPWGGGPCTQIKKKNRRLGSVGRSGGGPGGGGRGVCWGAVVPHPLLLVVWGVGGGGVGEVGGGGGGGGVRVGV